MEKCVVSHFGASNLCIQRLACCTISALLSLLLNAGIVCTRLTYSRVCVCGSTFQPADRQTDQSALLPVDATRAQTGCCCCSDCFVLYIIHLLKIPVELTGLTRSEVLLSEVRIARSGLQQFGQR